MKKIWIIIICAAVGTLLLAGGVLVLRLLWNRNRFHNETLESCRVSTGGGMLGGFSSASLRTLRDGSVVYEVSGKETHADREVTTTYPASSEALAEIKRLVQTYNLYGASKRPYSKMIALDADTTTIAFSFESDSFSVSENQVLSPKMREGFRAVERYLGTLAVGEGTVTRAPQTATLYLKSGYTLQFLVEDAFDGRLDAILSEERTVSAYGESGIVLCTGEQPDCSAAEPVREAPAGTMIYDGEREQIVILYADGTFDRDVWILAVLDGYVSSACPLIAEMQGEYRLYLN